MTAPGLRLRPLRVDDEAVCVAAHEEMTAEGFGFLLHHDAGDPWTDHVRRTTDAARGIDVPEGRVPALFLVADVDNEVVGRASIRLELNDYLRDYGGHIGYGVIAAHRRRGYASAILAQSLVIARAHGVDRVIVTCDHDNVGSARVIERNGGVFDCLVDDPVEDVTKRRYRID